MAQVLLLNLLGSKKEKFLHYLGRLDSKQGIGVNRLIQKGAKLVISAQDILNEFEELKNINKKIIKYNNCVKKEYRKIYSILSDIPLSLDEISNRTENTIRCTANLLSLMELEDLVILIVGRRIC